MGKETKYITQAVAALVKAQAAMAERIGRHDKIIDSGVWGAVERKTWLGVCHR